MAIPEYAEKPISFRPPIEAKKAIDKWIKSDTKNASTIYREIIIAGLVALGKMSENGNNKINR